MHLYYYLIILLFSYLLTYIMIPFVERFANKWNIIDQPGKYKIHVKPIPRLGGLAVYIAIMFTIVLFVPVKDLFGEIILFMGSGTLLAMTGFLDDAGKLHSQIKFLLVMPFIAMLLINSGIIINISNYYLINYGMTVLWIVGIICSFNLIDNMDGLCSGIASVAFSFFLLFSIITKQHLLATLNVAILGSALGFLKYNFYPARIFMGDGGAMFLGFFIAIMGIKLGTTDLSLNKNYLIPIFILIVPIFDTVLVTFSRVRRGLIPFTSPGKDHISHRLLKLGFTQSQVAVILYGVAFTGGLLGVLSFYLDYMISYILVGALVIIATIAYFWLENIPFEHQ